MEQIYLATHDPNVTEISQRVAESLTELTQSTLVLKKTAQL